MFLDSSDFALIELCLVFGTALALAGYELYRVRRDIRRREEAERQERSINR